MAADRKTELAVLLSNLYCSDFATGFIGVATWKIQGFVLYSIFTWAQQSRFEPGFESGLTGVHPSYIHTGSKVVVVKNFIPEVFI